MRGRLPPELIASAFIGLAVTIPTLLILLGWKRTLLLGLTVTALIVIYNFLPIKTVQVAISSDKLTKPVKILHITDFHSGLRFRANQIVEICKRNQPDMIVISGDLWDNRKLSDKEVAKVYELLDELADCCPYTFLIGGNHDQEVLGSDHLVRVWREGSLFKKELPDGFVLGEINVNGIGVNSHGWRSLGYDDSKFNLAACHHPTHVKNLIENNPEVDLVLAGDTHGGQVRLPPFGAVIVSDMPLFPEMNPDYKPLVRGLSRYESGRFYCIPDNHYAGSEPLLYVCTGVGYSGFPPIRLFCRPQVSLITISPSR